MICRMPATLTPPAQGLPRGRFIIDSDQLEVITSFASGRTPPHTTAPSVYTTPDFSGAYKKGVNLDADRTIEPDKGEKRVPLAALGWFIPARSGLVEAGAAEEE